MEEYHDRIKARFRQKLSSANNTTSTDDEQMWKEFMSRLNQRANNSTTVVDPNAVLSLCSRVETLLKDTKRILANQYSFLPDDIKYNGDDIVSPLVDTQSAYAYHGQALEKANTPWFMRNKQAD